MGKDRSSIGTRPVMYPHSNTGSNTPMDIYEIRRKNMRALATAIGGAKALSDRLDKQESLISRWIGKTAKKRIGPNVSREVEESFNLLKGWMDQPHPELWIESPTLELINKYRGLKTSSIVSNIEYGPSLVGKVPLISWVQAGHWQEIVDNYQPGDGEEMVPITTKVGPHAFALRVRGDSMEPEFAEGDMIVVDPDRQAENKSYVIVRLDDALEATFKQLVFDGDNRLLKPLNPRYPIMDINGRKATICGVVVSKIKSYY